MIMLLLFLIAGEISSGRWRRILFPPVFYFQLFLFGVVWMGKNLPDQQPGYFVGMPADQLIGIVMDEPVYGTNSVRFPVEIRYIVHCKDVRSATGKLILSIAQVVEDADLKLSYGDKLLFRNDVQKLYPAYNPKQFNYTRYLEHKNIYHQAYLQPKDIHLIGKDEGNGLVAHALSLRLYLVRKFTRFITDKEALEVCAALILGYRTNFQAETLAAFINTGTVHVLSVSGLHVGMVFFLLNFLLRFLDRIPYGRPIRFILILIAIWGYVLLTGMAPSILRAGVMISFLLVAGWGQRANQGLNSLFASACCLLIVDPFMIFDMGFQLSYMAVLGLFTLYPLLRKSFSIRNKWLRMIWQAVLVSLSAQLFTTPLALYYFHQFPNYFLLGNLFVMLPATVLMYAGIALAVCPLSIINMYLGVGLNYVCRMLLWGLQAIEGLPFAVLKGVDLSGAQLALFLLAIFFLLITWYSLRKNFLWLTLVSVGILVFSAAISTIEYTAYQGVKIYNMGREVAIGVFDRGRVSLLSTLDSVTHPRLAMQVVPDILRYTNLEEVKFHHLQLCKRQRMTVQTSMCSIGILEGGGVGNIPLKHDILIWRNPSAYDEVDGETVKNLQKVSLLIFDGSNPGWIIAERIKQADSLGISYYVLKNNFAYVWDKKYGK